MQREEVDDSPAVDLLILAHEGRGDGERDRPQVDQSQECTDGIHLRRKSDEDLLALTNVLGVKLMGQGSDTPVQLLVGVERLLERLAYKKDTSLRIGIPEAVDQLDAITVRWHFSML